MQFGQRVAVARMSIPQYGHAFVAGPGLIIALAIRNTTKATMMNPISVLMKMP